LAQKSDNAFDMKAGVYIHIPFCRSRCSYCDFATDIYNGALAEKYVETVVQEIKKFQVSSFKFQVSDKHSTLRTPHSAIETVYFGGGTPSLLKPNQLEKILDAVHSRFSVSDDAEITMEMNPGRLTIETLKNFRKLGVNRASYGGQTFNDRELARLGRMHTAEDVRVTIKLLRESGFENVSFDLITGLPGQSLKDWEKNLDEALALQPEHLSMYLLEVHEGTPLAQHIREGKQPKPDQDLAAEMYLLMLDKTANANYQHYEISNFCHSGFESRHNVKYWLCEPVYGFGCSAHSFDGLHTRWSNERDTVRYVEMIEREGKAIVETNLLTKDETQAEAIFLGLRMMRGVDLREHEKQFDVDVHSMYEEDLKRLEEAGLIEFESNAMKLTRKGALLSNEVFSVFV
jgi:oxygen-independent coproporphyrinogen-3 oxidase